MLIIFPYLMSNFGLHMFLWLVIELFLFYLNIFLKEPIYKEVIRLVSPNNLIYEKSTFKL